MFGVIGSTRRAALVLTTTLAFAAGGCGGGDETDEAVQTDGGATEASETAPAAAEQVLRFAWNAEPPSLDPGLATDTTSANVLLNIMDPLVKLSEPDLEPVPNLAESWEISADGLTVTLKLREDGNWTNGDPVTAGDFEDSWKRTISPEVAADYAYQFYGIKGALEYNSCDAKKDDCEALRDKVGVKALDDSTLEVELTTPQPWFLQQLAHHSFLAVHQATVEQFGEKWTEPENIVTNGPFRLTEWEHDSAITLEKWDEWRSAADVVLTRVEGRIITDGTTAIQAFEAGEVDALEEGMIPPAEIDRLKETPEYEEYPALLTEYYGFNVENVPDLDQRRAMAFAIDRQAIIDNVTKAGQVPATSFTPAGMPGFDVIEQSFLPATANIEKAKEYMSQVMDPKTKLNVFVNNAPGTKDVAVAIQGMWKELGIDTVIKVQEWAQFLEFLGPPPNESVDVFRLGWVGDYVDAINFLELWTCKSGINTTNFCDPEFDKLVEQARRTQDDEARYEIYAQIEAKLTGPDGALPIIPIYWGTYSTLERTTVQDTLNWSLLDQHDFSRVVVEEE